MKSSIKNGRSEIQLHTQENGDVKLTYIHKVSCISMSFNIDSAALFLLGLNIKQILSEDNDTTRI